MIVLILLAANAFHSSSALDPCNSVNVLPDMNKRGLNDTGHVDDHYNIPNRGRWYRVEGQRLLNNITHAHLQMCGTTFPIYMRGGVPKLTDGIVNRTSCTIIIGSACGHQQTIRIKVCQDFTAYFLLPPPGTASAYCFVPEDANGAAPTYRIPKPTLSHELVTEPGGFTHVQRLQFHCMFVPSTEDLYYQVFWFVDGDPVHMSKLAKKTSPDSFILTEDHFEKLGINIACSVRAKTTTSGIPGPMSSQSDQFYAGISIMTPTVTVYRGDAMHKRTVILLKPTVPIGCPAVFNNNCPVTVELSVPSQYQQCTGNVGSKQPRGNSHCGVKIPPNEWDREHEIEVFWVDDQAYTLNAENYKVSLHTIANDYHKVWGQIHLSDVNIEVRDDTQTWKGKECHAICDPHMRTFDGRYYDNQNPGTFILYERDDDSRKVQVQTKVTPCNAPARVFCVCAIAVRAGGDVFVIDRCPTIYRPIFAFRSCEDHILDVRKINENNYKIYLPSGTYLDVELLHYTGKDVMNLHMYPSTTDENHTHGLCGTLNGKKTDDFLTRDRVQTNNHDVFSRSWSVPDQENLITMGPELLQQLEVWNKTVQFCTCNEKGPIDRPVEKIQCSQNTIATCVKKHEATVRKQQHCRVKANRTLRKTSVITSPGHFTRRKRDVPRHWTKANATSYCNEYLQRSSSFEACSKDITVTNPQSSIDTCVLDIMATQTTMWASSARESLKSVCLKELKQNTTYQEEDSKDQPSIAQKIKEITCPNECSGNGQCDNGTCLCYDNFGAADCSIDIREPPQIYGVNLDSNGTCDIRTCQSAIVEGETFVDFGNLTCHYQLFQVYINGTTEFASNMTLPGQFNTLVEVFCPLPELWTEHVAKRSTDWSSSYEVPFVYRWSVAVSNDGEHFGEINELLVYNAECQIIVDNDASVFELEDEYCFIRGTCARDGMTNATDQCSVCKLELTRFEWSKNKDYCKIGGLCVANNSVDTHNNCSICNVVLSTDTWSKNPDYCLINGLCVADNMTKEGNDCSICKTTLSQSTWSRNTGFCMIDGECVPHHGDRSNTTCLTCDITQSTDNWNLKSGFCLIDDKCIADNETKEGSDCSVCHVKLSTSTWSGNTGYCLINGECIPDHSKKLNATCLQCDAMHMSNAWTLLPGYCLIDDLCVPDNATKEGDSCKVCDVKSSKSTWSRNMEYCTIDGHCILHRTAKPGTTCLQCDVTKSPDGWTLKPNFCRINGQCIAHNATSDTNKCLACDVKHSWDNWTRTCEPSTTSTLSSTITRATSRTPTKLTEVFTTISNVYNTTNDAISNISSGATPNAVPNSTPDTTDNIGNGADGTDKEKAERGKSSSSKAWIAGPAIGGLIVIIVIGAIIRRRRTKRDVETNYKVTYVASNS